MSKVEGFSTEWEFQFILGGEDGRPISTRVAMGLFEVITEWVEARGLQIGGGYRVPDEQAGNLLVVEEKRDEEAGGAGGAAAQGSDELRFTAWASLVGSEEGPYEVSRALGLEPASSLRAGEEVEVAPVLPQEARELRRHFFGATLETAVQGVIELLRPYKTEMQALRARGVHLCVKADGSRNDGDVRFLLPPAMLSTLAELGLPLEMVVYERWDRQVEEEDQED
jgi:hypothetical protein